MSAISEYVAAVENKDSKKLSEIFALDGSIGDYCTHGSGQREYHVYGREAIDMFFKHTFTFGKFSISEAKVVNETQAEFVANYGGYFVMAIATVRRVDDEGRILRLTVRPK